MKKYFLSIFIFLIPISSFANEILWHEPRQVENIGLFAPTTPKETPFPELGYYEDAIRTYSIASVYAKEKNIGDILLIILGRQPYRGDERLYIYRTSTGNTVLRDVSNQIAEKWFITPPEFLASFKISSQLQLLNIPGKITTTNIGDYILESLPLDETHQYSTGIYASIGTFNNPISHKDETLYVETKTGSANGFYIKRIDGFMSLYAPKLNIEHTARHIRWNDKKIRGGTYLEQDGAVCSMFPPTSLLKISDTQHGIPMLVWKDSDGPKVEWISFDTKKLRIVARTTTGKALYALTSDDPIYQIYYDSYFPENTSGKVKRGLEKFIQGRPFLFYKDSLGRYILLINESYYNQMLCA
ncbi:hypothetical protein HOO68_06455 [Candidatus Gracilibacteria bacterium]|nr:hypothetical protein [Candidatus Gracilibacteria bacterium]